MAPNKGTRNNRRFKEEVTRDDKKNKHNKSLKNKLRDVQRLLKKSDLPATVRVVQERMLDVLKQSLKEKAKEEKEKKNLKRYKQVKFFEKRKLVRRYKVCLKEIAECQESDEKREALQKELEEIKGHWNYVVHFPQDTRYVSLFPLTSCTDAKVLEKQGQIIKAITEKVASGELEDTSEAIEQMLNNSKMKGKRTFNVKPKKALRLNVEEDEATREERGENEESEDEGPSTSNLEDDFFIDTSPSTGDEIVKTKKKSGSRVKRSQFKIVKN